MRTPLFERMLIFGFGLGLGIVLSELWNDNNNNSGSVLSPFSSTKRTEATFREKKEEQVFLVADADDDNIDNNNGTSVASDMMLRTTSTSPSSNNVTRNVVRFVFIVGLEGTGHHLMKSFLTESPYVKQTFAANGVGIRPFKELELLMYDSFDGILFYHCNNYNTNYKKQQDASGGQNAFGGEGKNGSAVYNNPAMLEHAESKYKKLVATLRKIADDSSSSSNGTVVVLPINSIAPDSSRMGSYPNDGYRLNRGRQDCRVLNYPDLHVLYQACDDANNNNVDVYVDCGHVYLYRDPYQVIQSTMRRRMNSNSLEAMHLYVTNLRAIHGMFDVVHNNSRRRRTLGCYGFYEPNVMENVEMWESLRTLFGWTSRDEFDTHVRNVFDPTKLSPLNQSQKEHIAPPSIKQFMHAFQREHESVVELCHRQCAENVRR